jgi:glycerate 2-kinase
MISAESFQSSSLRRMPEGEAITRILAASINAVEPGTAVERFIHRVGEVVTVSDRAYNLGSFRRVALLGIGKASVAMSAQLAKLLGKRLQSGLVITKHTRDIPDFPIIIQEGDHPIPGARSLLAGRKTLEFVSSLGPEDLLFCLISGGGSALVSTPLDDLPLEDLQVLTYLLLACGARVDEINSLRRHLERLKGGGLVRASNGATIISLILSDVVGNPLEGIASGPTAPDPSSKSDVLALVEKYNIRGKIPASILSVLKQAPETPKPGNPIFLNVQNQIVGSSLQAAQAGMAQAEVEGFHPYLLRVDLQGEARQAAFELATFLRQAKKTGNPIPRPACIIAGGETTVSLRQIAGQAIPGKGKGGRNTEMALAAVTELADFPGVMLVTLATDGEDGPTDAAGAVVTGGTFHRAAGLGLDPGDFLDRNDSYTFFAGLDDLLKPGPTGTNVNDLVFLFVL